MPLDMSGLERFRAGLPGALDRGADRTADDVIELMQQLTPEDKGALKRSERKGPVTEVGRREVLVGGGDEGVDYARHVNDGTIYSEAQPFIEPTLKAINHKLRFREEIQALAKASKR